VIDTTGSFPISLLAQVLKLRIISSRATSAIKAVQTANYAIAGQQQTVTDEEVEKDVQRCLEMVAISRVFDIEGLWEVLGEVGRGSTSYDESDALPSSLDPNPNQQSHQVPTEILDSEEELTPEEALAISPRNEDSSGTEILIIDNLTHIITELLARKEKSEAHSFLTLLSLTIHTMTHTSNILTILHNGASPSKSTATSNTYPTTTTTPRNQHQRQPQIQNPSSIFPSNPVKPALGQIFTQFPELHLFISRLPKKREDAEALYGQDEESSSGYQKDVKCCYVVEVLKDETPNLSSTSGEGVGMGKDVDDGNEKGVKFGWREQRWTAVEMTDDGTGFMGAFQVKGNMRGMDLERERIGGLTDVGNVAKMYGFGGRRV
jgi:hypothetical protein